MTEQETTGATEQPTAVQSANQVQQPQAAAPQQAAPTPAADSCPECGSGMAADQRYCLNCGWRRGGARVDYEAQILRTGPGTTEVTVATAPRSQWSPMVAIGAI